MGILVGCRVMTGTTISHRAEVGEETDKHRFVLKLLPEICTERTYYIAFAANHELQVRTGRDGVPILTR